MRAVYALYAVIFVFWFVVAGIALPKTLIADRVEYGSDEERLAAHYARVRVANAGGFGQRLLDVEMRVLSVRPDPTGCTWGYREPIAQIVTIQTYTLWGVPFETIEVTCDAERRL
jgi:hypothetical protein